MEKNGRDLEQPPTYEEVIAAYDEWISERSSKGVMFAQSALRVSFDEGAVTVTLDPEKSGATYSALMEASPFDNLADLFASPVAFDNDEGRWLRRRVERIIVVDIDGRELGRTTSGEANWRATWFK